MQTMSERKELRSAVEKWKTSRAPHFRPAPNKAAISKPADIASVNQRQPIDRSGEYSGRDADSLKRVRGISIAVALCVLFVWLPLLWAIWPKR